MSHLRDRKRPPHQLPSWVKPGSWFFITICCAPRGKNHLCTAAASNVIFESVAHRHTQGDWFAHVVLLMPDHLHALLAFPPHRSIEKSIRLWKSYLARHHGIRWQRDFFDHRLRTDAAWEEKARYIRMNPVRSGFVVDPNQWPYVWEPA